MAKWPLGMKNETVFIPSKKKKKKLKEGKNPLLSFFKPNIGLWGLLCAPKSRFIWSINLIY